MWPYSPFSEAATLQETWTLRQATWSDSNWGLLLKDLVLLDARKEEMLNLWDVLLTPHSRQLIPLGRFCRPWKHHYMSTLPVQLYIHIIWKFVVCCTKTELHLWRQFSEVLSLCLSREGFLCILHIFFPSFCICMHKHLLHYTSGWESWACSVWRRHLRAISSA